MNNICGACGVGFETEQQYLDHQCDTTGFTPADIEHQDVITDGNFSKIAEEACKRGEERVAEEHMIKEGTADDAEIPSAKVEG